MNLVIDLAKQALPVLYFLASSLVIIVVGISIVRYGRGGGKLEVQLGPLKYNCQQDELLQKTKAEYDKLNEDCKQKASVQAHLRDISIVISRLMLASSLEGFAKERDQVYTFILTGLAGQLAKHRDDFNRATILSLAEPGKLRLLASPYHSSDDLKNKRLSIAKSIAGHVFTTGDKYEAKDVLADPLFEKGKSQPRYRNLVCVPISSGEIPAKVMGVLSLDSEKVGCFTKDDIDYLEHYACLIALVMALDNLLTEHGIFAPQGR